MKSILSNKRILEIVEDSVDGHTYAAHSNDICGAIKQALSEQLDGLIECAEKDVDTDKPFAVHAWHYLKLMRDSNDSS